MKFNTEQREKIRDFLMEKALVRSAIIYGNEGLGKSSAIRENILDLDSTTITFSKDFFLPFECIKKALALSLNARREEIISALSRAYVLNHCILYENVEYCDVDSLELIKQVILFHNTYGLSAVSLFELNSDKIPDFFKQVNAANILFTELSDTAIEYYIQMTIYADNYTQLTYVCKQLAVIAKGNLLSLNLAQNILLQKGILVRVSPGNLLKYTGAKFSDNLLFLYMDLFNILDSHIQDTLRIIVPFEDRIDITLLKKTFSRCKMIEFYLEEISKYRSFIFKRQERTPYDTPLVYYVFPTVRAKEAVIESTLEGYFYQITAELYQHLEKMYQQARCNPQISKEDYIYLLALLTKLRNHNLTINHLPYYVELMQYYLECSSYGAVVMQAEQFLSFNVLSIIQINAEQPQFFRIYFKALLALGQYNLIITYLDKLPDWDIKLLIAYAYYNSGKPQRALGLCKELEEQHKCGEVFSLEASIYDWLGDNKQSLASFKKAISFISNNEELKYSLYRKYSLYIDFELPECKSYVKKALDYYKTLSTRKYAETLHNYGTDSIITFLPEGMKDLEKAKELFYRICEKEVYYPLNSLAIGYCIQEKYYKAIEIWEKIDTQQIEIDFCRFAILNNLFCAYLKVNDLKMANSMRIQLSMQLNLLEIDRNLKSFAKEKPDIQHQIRQFLLNCALLELKQENIPEALKYFNLSFDCSNYHSTMLYLIQNQVAELQERCSNTTLLNRLYNKIKLKKLGDPGRLASFYAKNKMYYCILMFWGDN